MSYREAQEICNMRQIVDAEENVRQAPPSTTLKKTPTTVKKTCAYSKTPSHKCSLQTSTVVQEGNAQAQ